MSEAEKQVMLASGSLMSISEIAKETPYSAEYLSLLARKGKLKAVKIARDWLTTREAVLSYIREQRSKHMEALEELEMVERRLA
jgi:hypothetical protein